MSGWSVVALDKGLGEHAEAWDRLNRERFGAHPLLSALFVDGLLRQLGAGNEYLCTLRDEAGVQAMLILQRRRGIAWRSFAPPQVQIGPTMVPERRMLDDLLPSLPGTALQLDLLCNDPSFGAVLAEVQPPTHRMAHTLTMRIALDGSYADYWAARPRQLAKNMRRYERRAIDDGLPPRVVRLDTPDQVDAGVERYAAMEAAGWKGKIGTALGSTPEQYAFFRNLMRDGARQGQALVYELWLGEQLAASRLLVSSGDMMVILKTSYNEELARYAPGRLLLRAVIEDAFASFPGKAIEFYTDASPEQLEWASAHRWIEHLTLYRTRFGGVMANGLKALRALRVRQAQAADEASAVEVYTRPEALPAEVRQFLERAETRNLQFGFDWYRNLVETVYSGHEGIRLYVLRSGDKILAVLPLRIERAALGWQAHALSNFYSALYEPALAPGTKASDLLPLFTALRREFPRLGSLMLAPMAPASHAYVVLCEALCSGGWFPFEFFAFGNWYQRVRTGWLDYLAEREGSVRSTIRRMGKKFAAEGGVLEVVTSPDDLPGAIEAYRKVYAASWKKPEPFDDFMPGLLQLCAAKGVLRLGLARLHGEPVAVQVWIVGHGRAEIYKVAYDERFRDYSPGTLVTAMLIRHVIETDQVAEIDYLIGDDPYKKTWMGERRERWGLVAYHLGSLPGVLGFLREASGRAIKYVRQSLRRPRDQGGGKPESGTAASVKPLNPAA
ncbi:hypothetical protein B0920_24335 [Massilia sp. KIM]|uniref:GNAT family N-acetyltransferase n=1 Tax=Massilia sp. KIM TaxID=1955422 RepID=UPI00098FC39D|nr:GNAT family N-acetyltransferase [Massilia sp. KIM]OON59505.1 hypothetical protein B0920_24335 [Massilia sp. KIM]